MTMPTRKLGPFDVSAIGLGCMNLSHAYGAPVSAEQGERVLLAALDAGVTLFDTATLYGFGANETLVGKVMKPHRRKFILASKCGMQGVDVVGDGKLVAGKLLGAQVAAVPLYFPNRYFRKRPWLEGLSVDPFNFLTFRAMRVAPAK